MKIELFSVPGCSACVTIRESLQFISQDQLGIEVEEVDLSIDPQRGRKYGILACPALVIDGKLEAIGAISLRRLRRLIHEVELGGTQSQVDLDGGVKQRQNPAIKAER